MTETTGFTRRDVQDILAVVDKLEDVEIQLETGDIKLFIKKGAIAHSPSADSLGTSLQVQTEGVPPVAPQMQQPQVDSQERERVEPTVFKALADGMLAIRAPMVGRFFVAPSPNDPPFVQLGQKVRQDDSVAVLEVMKLFSTIQAGVEGTIVEVVAENGEMVEFDQVLFVVKPD